MTTILTRPASRLTVAAMLPDRCRIAVVAPAGMYSPERLQSGIATLRAWGWDPVLAPNAAAQFRYTAGSTDQRAADLTWAFTEPGLAAVWFARGGYGTFAAMADLPWQRLDGRPAIGFSDATALLSAMHQRGMPAIHGPVLQGLADPAADAPGAVLVDADSRAVLHRLLATGVPTSLAGTRLCGPDRVVQGPVVGGNLTVLASLCGTSEQLRGKGAIVVLEELNEAPYRIDRLLSQLLASGGLDGVAGIALGDFLNCEPKDADWTLDDVLRDLLSPLGVPVLTGLPVGHGARNFAFPYGGLAEMDGDGVHFL
jgi:muramoyltetrapeptide carboxypeptidase